MQTDADANYYYGEEFKNSPPTVSIVTGVMGPQAAVNRRNGQPDMSQVYGEKNWQTWAQDLNDQEDAATAKAQARPPYRSWVQTDADANYYNGEEFKNSPPTVAIVTGVMGPQAAVNRRNGQPDMSQVYGEKNWQAWA